MKRNNTLEEITDGRLYHANDLARLECNDCSGCSACCRNMEALVLDPYDIHQLKRGLQMDFSQLMSQGVALTMVDGMLLPIMQTQGSRGQCFYLNEEGRCKIHSFRPGICRLFPLGRYYHDGTFSYILQTGECQKERIGKVKIKKWLGIPNLKSYESYILIWHDFLKKVQEQLPDLDDNNLRILHTYILNQFYVKEYDEAFYEDFGKRMDAVMLALQL